MRILLIEDRKELAQFVGDKLAQLGIDSDYVGTVGDAFLALSTTQYAALVLDLGLPDDDGIVLLRKIRQSGHTIPVLILTARSGIEDKVTGLGEGADDYLVKPFIMEELVARLRALLRRPSNLLGQKISSGNVSFDTGSRQVFIAGIVQPLPGREVSVLELLLRVSGKVVTKRLLEDQLFGIEGDVGSNVLEVYIHRLRRLLSDAGATAHIHTVRGVGYMMVADRPGREIQH